MTDTQDKLLALKAEVLQAIAQPVRLAILELLANGELCVCDIAERVGAKRSNVSRHLGVMLRAGVVDVRKDGLKMVYRLRTPCLLKALACVEKALKQRVGDELAALERA